MKVFLFPGQGAQYKGMGKGLWASYRQIADAASNILGYSIEELCLLDPQNHLRLTQYTQPALYVVNALNLYRLQEAGESPDGLAGHSLGEYSALLAAGCFDFATGLRLVQKRGQLMSEARGGGMAAVLGIRAEELQTLLSAAGLDHVDLANLNSPTQSVIAADSEAIRSVEKLLAGRDVKFVMLNVSAAFHSRHMRPAQQEFAAFLRDFNFSDPAIPVIANATARPYGAGQVAALLAQQIVSPVRWTDSIRYLMGQGDFTYFEMGADPTRIGGTVLGKLVDEIRRTETPLSIALPERTDSDAAAMDATGVGTSGTRHLPLNEAARPGRTDVQLADVAQPRREWGRAEGACALGSEVFRLRYGLQYAYVAGAMYRGTASADLVVRMGQAGMMGYFGTGGLTLDMIETAIQSIQARLSRGEAYGMNLLAEYADPASERATVDLYLKYGVHHIEAAAFLQMTPAVVLFRVKGLRRKQDGGVECLHHVLAKVSRLEVAQAFMSPPPAHLVKALLAEGVITVEQAQLAERVPMSHDICVEADSGGHTDGAIPNIVLPAMQQLRHSMNELHRYAEPICMGLAGGIGTPAAAASAFVMGADFILTGSVNQCTVESGATEIVKDLLQEASIHDMAYAPAGDMFEFGSRVQVLKKGLLFPMRANKLLALYMHYDRLEEIPAETRTQLERGFFKRSLAEVWDDALRHLSEGGRQAEVSRLQTNHKARMARVFRWYFHYSTRLAFSGSRDDLVNYQVHCGPALGAFNQWVKGTEIESWRKRHVDDVALRLMHAADEYIDAHFEERNRLRPAAARPLADAIVG